MTAPVEREPLDTASSLARAGVIARTAAIDYLVVYPPRIIALSTLPRVLAQVAFYSLIGLAVGGPDGERFAFVGATVHILTLATVVRGPDVLVDEKVEGTMYRLRLGCWNVLGVTAIRWWTYLLEALLSAAVATVGVGLALGLWETSVQLLACAPLFLLIAASTSALGMAAAALSVGRRADVLVTNLLAFSLLLVGGVLAPLKELGGWSAISEVMPMTHGLLAVRTALEGQPVAGLALKEALVGLAWLAVAAGTLRLQSHRARRGGFDDFV